MIAAPSTTGIVILGITLVLFGLAAARYSANTGQASLGASDLTIWLLHPNANPVGLASGPTAAVESL